MTEDALGETAVQPRESAAPLQDLFGLVGTVLAGKYQIERVVARGGFGVVYRAHHTSLGTVAAVKVLVVPEAFRGDRRASFLDGFRLEARTIAALDHAAIVRVVDFGEIASDDGTVPWMSMEWLDGTTLQDDLDARRGAAPRSPRETLALLRPAFDALACAHDAGVAHRDLKPANLMLARSRRGEVSLRVLDFGIAKVMDREEQPGSGLTQTRSELAAFTLGYAAPEQLSRTRTGPWTDVHALALIVTETLSGCAPYPERDATQAMAAVFLPTRPTPGRFAVRVGPWEEILGRALALSPTERPPNAAALFTPMPKTL